MVHPLLQCLVDDGHHLPGYGRIQGVQIRYPAKADLLQHPQFRIRLEAALAGEQLEKHETEGIQVRPVVQGLPRGLLGAHVEQLPFERPGDRVAGLARRLGDAEVHQLHRPVRGDDHVLGGDVPVDQLQFPIIKTPLAMGVVQSSRDLHRDERSHLLREGQPVLAHFLQQRPEVAAVHVFHGDVVGAARLPEIEDLHDVRMGQLGRQLGLVDEHRDEILVVAEVRQDALDRHDLLEALHAPLLGLEQLGHAAHGDLLQQVVVPVLLQDLGTYRRAACPGPDRRGRDRWNARGGPAPFEGIIHPRNATEGEIRSPQRLGCALGRRRGKRRLGCGKRPRRNGPHGHPGQPGLLWRGRGEGLHLLKQVAEDVLGAQGCLGLRRGRNGGLGGQRLEEGEGILWGHRGRLQVLQQVAEDVLAGELGGAGTEPPEGGGDLQIRLGPFQEALNAHAPTPHPPRRGALREDEHRQAGIQGPQSAGDLVPRLIRSG